MLICIVAVGRAFVAKEPVCEKEPIPAGYDSYYIHDPAANEEHRTQDGNEYVHEYYIKNPAQILPQYLVTFTYDPSNEKAVLPEVPHH